LFVQVTQFCVLDEGLFFSDRKNLWGSEHFTHSAGEEVSETNDCKEATVHFLTYLEAEQAGEVGTNDGSNNFTDALE
jgi:hypothetical protein